MVLQYECVHAAYDEIKDRFQSPNGVYGSSIFRNVKEIKDIETVSVP